MNKKPEISKYFIENFFNKNYKFSYVQKFIEKEKNDINYLLWMYQTIELTLFAVLYSPTKKAGLEIEDINKEFNEKTLNRLINRYNKKFPNDKYKLKDHLDNIRKQRNNFTHSFFIYISSRNSKKEAFEEGRYLLKSYIKKAEIVLILAGTVLA